MNRRDEIIASLVSVCGVMSGYAPEMPKGATIKDGRVYGASGKFIEVYEGKWLEVKDGARNGWWRFHEHYDRNGYCDNPARGY